MLRKSNKQIHKVVHRLLWDSTSVISTASTTTFNTYKYVLSAIFMVLDKEMSIRLDIDSKIQKQGLRRTWSWVASAGGIE